MFDRNINTLYAAERLSICAQKEGKQAYIHISLDTGMSRLGARDDEMSIEMIEKIKGLSNLVVEGIFTHFTSSDALTTAINKASEAIFFFISLIFCLMISKCIPA